MTERPEPQRADRAVMRATFQAMVFANYKDEEIAQYMTVAAQEMGSLNKADIRRNDHRG